MSARRRGLTIGVVLERLRDEFPDLTISKIRFLEAEGLVTPERTASGYRQFSPADVERLRYILAAQRDRFWPLKVIREALDALDRGLTPGVDGPSAPGEAGPTSGRGGHPGLPVVPTPPENPDLPSVAELGATPQLRLTEAELVEASGITAALLGSLRQFGLVHPDAAGHYDDIALAVTRAAGALASYGVEARHLRAFRTAAEREVGLVEQVAGPLRAARGRRGSEAPTDPTLELVHHCLALHAALVRAQLGR
ncbi:MAG TPA: MerR family transcriptional regulator [Microthrixaceae bacterium]|nr:MerR family transcriptional regulator [Microthrixaceae bacterium]